MLNNPFRHNNIIIFKNIPLQIRHKQKNIKRIFADYKTLSTFAALKQRNQHRSFEKFENEK